MNDRITWRTAAFAGYRGSVGGMELFAVNWQTSTNSKNYTVATRLPEAGREQDFDELEEAKEHAEGLLVAFVERLGGSFYFPPIA